jgi:hypothetical protein
MIDPETKRAWRRMQKEVKENAPIVLRGLASSGKQIPGKLYSAAVRGCKSLTGAPKRGVLRLLVEKRWSPGSAACGCARRSTRCNPLA